MRVRIVVKDGKLGFFTEDGTFEQGGKQIFALRQQLGLAGLDIALDGPVEQHRHDDQPARTYNEQGQVSHSHDGGETLHPH